MAGWAGGTALLLGMPLLGVWLSGAPLAPYLEMPPRTNFVTHAPFSWPVFWGLALFIVIVVKPFVFRIFETRRRRVFPDSGGRAGRFPWWGWLALLAGLMAWTLAWTRFPCFDAFQPFTFTPLWLAYIVVMNALAFRRTGRSPLTHQTGAFLGLFPISAIFWWFFEYLNRFVQNWHYIGIGTPTAEEYLLRAMLPFATVLPAFVATRAWLAGYPGLWMGLADWKPLAPARPRLLACLALTVAALGLAGIGIWHEFLFPLLWVSPLTGE